MLNFIEGPCIDLSNQLKENIYHYRYQVFVKRLGWELNTSRERETDQFDHDDARYLIAQDNDQAIVGFARMLPTSHPYLLEQVFPELLNGMSPPKDQTTWELSRFTSMDLQKTPPIDNRQLSDDNTIKLLIKVLSVAYQHGATQLISVSPMGVERLLRRAGIKACRAGPPQTINGHRLIACKINIVEHIGLFKGHA